jgi:glycosyltransferase involved in cell wall biosynthesis
MSGLSPGSPLFTVLIVAGGNRRAFVRQAVESVCEARRRLASHEVEVILVTDFVEQSLVAFAESVRVRWILSEGPVGAMLSDGTAEAKGAYIAFLDDDDLFTSSRLERARAVLQRHPGVGYYHTAYKMFASTGRVATIDHSRASAIDAVFVSSYPQNARLIRLLASSNEEQNLSSVIIERRVWERARKMLPRVVGATDTFGLFLALGSGCGVIFDDYVGTLVRRHPTNHSTSTRHHDVRLAMRQVISEMVATLNGSAETMELLVIRQARESILDATMGGPIDRKGILCAVNALRRARYELDISKNLGYLFLGGLCLIDSTIARVVGRPYIWLITGANFDFAEDSSSGGY